MHRFCSPRFLPSFMAGLARRGSPLIMSPNPPVSRVSRLHPGPWNTATLSQVEGDESGKPYMRLPIPSAKVNTRGAILDVRGGHVIRNKDDRWNTSEVIYTKHDTRGQFVKYSTGSEEDGRSTTGYHKGELDVTDKEELSDDGEFDYVLAGSRHRDSSIYRNITNSSWKKEYRIAERNETRLEAMALSDPPDCIIHEGTCMQHPPRCMLQIFSLELVKIYVHGGLLELYGYIAVRDELDPLLNYVVNVSRDEPIVVEKGSLIKMAGPKRGIDMMHYALIEFDMRIKAGQQEEDDLQLIDGASSIGPAGPWNGLSTIRITGDCGAIDLTFSRLEAAVEATVEVLVSEVQSTFSLSLDCLTSGLNKEILLFDGAITEPCCLKKSVVAVLLDSSIDLKFKLGSLFSNSDQRCCYFKSKVHGRDTQEIKTDFALISVKMTWSTLPAAI